MRCSSIGISTERDSPATASARVRKASHDVRGREAIEPGETIRMAVECEIEWTLLRLLPAPDDGAFQLSCGRRRSRSRRASSVRVRMGTWAAARGSAVIPRRISSIDLHALDVGSPVSARSGPSAGWGNDDP